MALFSDDEVSAQPVVVKTLSEGGDRDVFVMEAERLCRLSHENIIHCLGVVVEPGPPMLVLDLMLQQSLRSLLEQTRPSALQRLTMALDVASGLAYLQSAATVHGALCGRNILVDDQGRCKVCDIIISVIWDDLGALQISGFAPHKREAHSMLRWQAPECWMDPPVRTWASDSWSLGICMHEMYSRTVEAVAGIDDNKLISDTRRGARPAMEPACPAPVYSLMVRLWHPCPQFRCVLCPCAVTLQCIGRPTAALVRDAIEVMCDREDDDTHVLSEVTNGELHRVYLNATLPDRQKVVLKPHIAGFSV